MKKVLKNKKIPFEWCDAVDGASMSREEVLRDVSLLGRIFMTKGMIGCFLSHRKCWQRCVELQEPLLIFEDDVILQEHFYQIVSNILQSVDETKRSYIEWDLMLLGALGKFS